MVSHQFVKAHDTSHGSGVRIVNDLSYVGNNHHSTVVKRTKCYHAEVGFKMVKRSQLTKEDE